MAGPTESGSGLPDALARLATLDFAQGVLDAVRRRERCAVGGLVGASRAALLAALAPGLPRPRLVITAGPDEAGVLRDDLGELLGSEDAVRLLPAFDATLPSRRARERDRLITRVAVLEALASGNPPEFVVASLSAVLQPVPRPEVLERGTVRVAVGRPLDTDDLAKRLAEAGFARVPMVEAPGEWSQRGGIVDVHAHGRDLPVRVELFGDDVESIREFDPLTQRSSAEVREVALPLLSADEAVGLGGGDDPQAVRRALKKALLVSALLPGDAVIVHDDPAAAAAWVARFDRARPEEELGTMYARFTATTNTLATLSLSSAPVTPDEGVNARILGATGLARDLVTFADALDALLERNREVHLCCATEGDESRVRSMLAEVGRADSPGLHVRRGRLSHGFQVPALGVALLSYDELFGRTRLPRPRSGSTRRSSAAPQWNDFRKGDAVVHLEHGIGIYRGLVRREKDGAPTDHLTIEFAKGTLVHVPVTKSALVHRYVGTSEGKPRLSTVGGSAWSKRKAAVASSLDDVAAQLLRTQAVRAARPGLAFPPDGPEQLEFEATFPFDLTPDQATAIAAIKEDMERDVPMDRLLCGDVGFGKTELAVRAAFKTVLAGRQVAVLVPTTVLAEQHGAVFEERFAGYPDERGRALPLPHRKGEQREILERCGRRPGGRGDRHPPPRLRPTCSLHATWGCS